MGLALALIVMGVLILLDRMGMHYGLREGWPWLIIALGIGGALSKRQEHRSLDHDDSRHLHPGVKILFHSSLHSGSDEDLLPSGASHRDWIALAVEIQAGLIPVTGFMFRVMDLPLKSRIY